MGQQSIALQVQMQGRWAYSISATQKQAFARLIVGKPAEQAKSILMQQAGIANVLIKMNNIQNDSMPNDPMQISINVQILDAIRLWAKGTFLMFPSLHRKFERKTD